MSNQVTNSYYILTKNEWQSSTANNPYIWERLKWKRTKLDSSYKPFILGDHWGHGGRACSTWSLRCIYTNSMVDQNNRWMTNLNLDHIWSLPNRVLIRALQVFMDVGMILSTRRLTFNNTIPEIPWVITFVFNKN